MDLQPLGDRLIVEVLDEEEIDRRRHRPARHRQGEAAARQGPGRRPRLAQREDGERIRWTSPSGDEIVFSKYGGTEVKVGPTRSLILRESDVLARCRRHESKSKGKRELAGATA